MYIVHGHLKTKRKRETMHVEQVSEMNEVKQSEGIKSENYKTKQNNKM